MTRKKRSSPAAPTESSATNDNNKPDAVIIVVMPGDNVTSHLASKTPTPTTTPPPPTMTTAGEGGSSTKKWLLGTGLRYDSQQQQVFATLAGRLMRPASNNSSQSNSSSNGNCYYVRTNTRRYYQPALHDRVVGLIEDRIGVDAGTGGDLYRVNINASQSALLSNMSFEGAIKRNKPSLTSGQLIYARIASCSSVNHQPTSASLLNASSATVSFTTTAASSSWMDPTLSCILGSQDVGIPRKDWMTNEGCYGVLRGGTLCRISTGLARELLHPTDCVVLNELARYASPPQQQHNQQQPHIPFEIAIGVNGYLWIQSSAPDYTIMIQNAILNSQVMTEEQVRSMVKSLVYTVEKQRQQRRDAATGNDDMEY